MSKVKLFFLKPRNLYFVLAIVIILIAVLTPTLLIWKKNTTPILIHSNEDFEKYKFPGEGTADSPYLIQNRTITTSDYYAIGIGNVSKYFVIQNNILKSQRYSIFLAIQEPDIAEIRNNVLNGEGAGVYIIDTPGCKILNNTFRNSQAGAAVFNLNGETNNYHIINNTFYSILNEEIIILKSTNSKIENNFCTYENQEEDQNVGKRGIFLINSENATIRNNSLTNKGITLSDDTLEAYLSKIIENNSVNGKEVGYLINRENELIDETKYSQLYLINCTNVNVTNLVSDQTGIGLGVMYCTECYVTDNTFTNQGWAGVAIYESSLIHLTSNSFDTNYRGVYAINSQNITIFENTFGNNVYGCEFENCTFELIDNTFTNNEVDVDD